MKILFDTNVLPNVFLEREPFYESSLQVLAMAEQITIEGSGHFGRMHVQPNLRIMKMLFFISLGIRQN